jgi:hypothetical protein
MGSLILVILVISLLIIFINKVSTQTLNNPEPHYSQNTTIQIKPPIKTSQPLLYKKAGVKSFAMKGMYYRDLDPESDKGDFMGYAECEDNSSDIFAVAIYNNEDTHFGYTRRGNERLSNSINHWHQGKVIVWGYLFYDDYRDRWEGNVYIPVGYQANLLEKFEDILQLVNFNIKLIKNKNKSTDKFFKILENHKRIEQLIIDVGNPSELEYAFPKNVIPSISSHLEKEENWEKLIELNEYQDLILMLNDKYRKTTLNRIKMAKAKLLE